MFLLSSSPPCTCAMRLFLSSSLLFSALIVCVATSNTLGRHLLSTPQNQTCIHDDLSALLHLKQGFDYDTPDCNLSSWNATNKDCCSWDRVSCDGSTGQVISLELTFCVTSGSLDFGSSALGGLQSLQQLYLWLGSSSHFPSGLDKLPNLTHLGLAGGLSRQIPLAMSRLKHLVSLEELSLDSVSAHGGDWGQALSSLPSLRKLTKSGCEISGPIHPSVCRLLFLTELDLSYTNLSSAMPSFIANFTSLTSLSLRSYHLHGKFHPSI